MEYTKERLKKTICKYAFCRTVELDMKFPPITENKDWYIKLWDAIWEELDDIDDDFVPVLTELNEKGYYTDGCCSGHLEKIEKYGTWNIYLSFWYIYGFKDMPLKAGKNKAMFCAEYNGSKNASIEEKNKARLDKLDELLEWAKKLPFCEESKLDYRIEDGWVMFQNRKIYDVSDLKQV